MEVGPHSQCGRWLPPVGSFDRNQGRAGRRAAAPLCRHDARQGSFAPDRAAALLCSRAAGQWRPPSLRVAHAVHSGNLAEQIRAPRLAEGCCRNRGGEAFAHAGRYRRAGKAELGLERDSTKRTQTPLIPAKAGIQGRVQRAGSRLRGDERNGDSRSKSIGLCPGGPQSDYSRANRSSSALPMTETELKLIAAAATIGLSNRPKAG